MKIRTLLLIAALLIPGLAQAQVPNFESVARQTFESRPAEIAQLRRICDETDALRAQFGEDDPRVQDGELRANALKGMFARRIAFAVHQIDARFGLRRKESGGRAIRPIDGASLATDVLMLQDTGQIVDVMSDRNASWGVTAGDTQPLNQWVLPLPEVGDQPIPVPTPTPTPVPVPTPVPQPVPSPVVDGAIVPLLERIIALQQSQLNAILIIDTTTKDTNQHVINIDRTFAQTVGALSKFLGKYVAPALGGFIAARKLN